jgi:hypothetical protein
MIWKQMIKMRSKTFLPTKIPTRLARLSLRSAGLCGWLKSTPPTARAVQAVARINDAMQPRLKLN